MSEAEVTLENAMMEETQQSRRILLVRKRLFVLVGLLCLVSIAVAVFSGIRINEENEWLAQCALNNRNLVQAVDLARTAQVHFKKQVQEWKDVLLRGSNPDLYKKHYQAFENEEKAARELMEKLKLLLDEMQLPKDAVEEFLRSHKVLGEKYREAIQAYDQSSPESGFRVDDMVKGIDRQATDLVDDIVELMQVQSETCLEDQFERTAVKVERDRHFYEGIVVLIGGGIFLGLFFAMTIIGDLRKSK